VEAAGEERVRLDTWLWAARLLKTRALAAEAAKGGHVEVNGQRAKPGRELRPGDRLELTLGELRMALVVRGLARRRGPASVAQRLYEETPESVAARERHTAQRRAQAAAEPQPPGGARPTKRDRRRLEQARGRRGRG
jgi:ribosome-associated heat shock protein Hsp15